MRFSSLPLGRRILIVVVTLAIVTAIAWVIRVIVGFTPVWLDAILVVGIVAFAVVGIRYDNRIRRRMEASGQLPAKPRRDR